MAGKGRPPLPVGTYGLVSVAHAPNSTPQKPIYRASARFRDFDGSTRRVIRQGPTKNAARTALTVALSTRQRHQEDTLLSSRTTVADLMNQFLASNTVWSTNTRDRYELAAEQIKAEIGLLRLSEFTRSAVNTALTRITAKHGPASAKSAKSVLNGMAKFALRFDAIPANPVRDAIAITQPRRDQPRALTPTEADTLCDALRTDPQASYYTDRDEPGTRYDLADLIEFMLGTGCRIGEACAARYRAFDLEAGTWEINATAVRVKGAGMVVQEKPKTAAGWRVLALPSFVVEIVRRRAEEPTLANTAGLVFPSPTARTVRDPSNTAADLRLMFDRHGFPWLHSHLLRKTVATRLDESGLSARQIADQLGHSQPSLTMDKYMGRAVVSTDAARILDR